MAKQLETFDNGDLPDALQVNNNINFSLGVSIVNNLDADIGVKLVNSGGVLLADETGINTANSDGVVCLVADTFIAGGTIYDNIDDSSIDATLWTTATGESGVVSENAERITVFAPGEIDSATLTSNGSGSNLNMNSGTTYVLFDLDHTDGGGTGKLQITNTSTTVDIYTFSDETRRAFLLKVDASGNLATLWHHTAKNTWTALATNIDISTVTTNKYFRLTIPPGGAYDRFDLYKICNYTTDATSELRTSAITNLVSSAKAFFSVYHFKNGSTDVTGEISLNSGSNFNAAVLNQLTTIDNAGTGMVLKAFLKTNNNGTPDEIDYLVGYAN